MTNEIPVREAKRERFSTYRPRKQGQMNMGPNKVKLAERTQTDINLIMRKYLLNGIVDHQNPKMAQYGDFSNAVEYWDALNKIQSANDMFMGLPSNVRDAVQNDPGKFMELMQDESRRDELEKLGLVEPKEAKAIVTDTVTDPVIAGGE